MATHSRICFTSSCAKFVIPAPRNACCNPSSAIFGPKSRATDTTARATPIFNPVHPPTTAHSPTPSTASHHENFSSAPRFVRHAPAACNATCSAPASSSARNKPSNTEPTAAVTSGPKENCEPASRFMSRE